MSAVLDCHKCTGCPSLAEPPCMRVCPGDLIRRSAEGKAELRSTSECWDCVACVKACPNQALGLSLPVAVGGRGTVLRARTRGDGTEWTIERPDGTRELLTVSTQYIL